MPAYNLDEIKTDLVLVGADPEVFAFNGETNNYVSLHDKFPGTKREPFPVNSNISIQVDNVLAEFNIRPSSNRDEFVSQILEGLDICQSEVAKHGLHIAVVPSAVLPKEEVDNPWAETFGCEPDFDAYDDGQPNVKPNLSEIVRMYGSESYRGLRSAGGHIHVGYLQNNNKYGYDFSPLDMVKAMDFVLGPWSIMNDDDSDRRNLYGKAGCFRPKPYGVEYRTLSNFWLRDTSFISKAYELTLAAYKICCLNSIQKPITPENPIQRYLKRDIFAYSKDIREMINSGDKKTAYTYMKHIETWYGPIFN